MNKNPQMSDRFRKAQSSLYVKESMHYGFIRSYLDLNQTDRLIQILKLKYKYGIFVDSFTANMIMDFYLRKSHFKMAALCAHEVMLQELSENQLTLAHSLQSCLKYIWSVKSSQDAEQLEDFEKEQQPQQQEDEKPVIDLFYFQI